MRNKAIKIVDNESGLSLEICQRAYNGTSFSPERRGEQYRDGIISDVEKILTTLNYEIEKGINVDGLRVHQERFINGYLKRAVELINAKSNTFSVNITGGSNFNNSKHQKMNDREHKKSDALADYYNYMMDKIKKIVKVDDTIESVEKELNDMILYHETSKKLNALGRKKISFEEKLKLITTITDNVTHAKKFIDNLNNNSQFYTVNSNEKVKRLKAKLAKMKSYADKENKSNTYNFGEVITDYKIDRYRIIFNEIPSKEDRDTLKKLGFRFSPKSKEWLQRLTHRGRGKVLELVEYFKDEDDE